MVSDSWKSFKDDEESNRFLKDPAVKSSNSVKSLKEVYFDDYRAIIHFGGRVAVIPLAKGEVTLTWQTMCIRKPFVNDISFSSIVLGRWSELYVMASHG